MLLVLPRHPQLSLLDILLAAENSTAVAWVLHTSPFALLQASMAEAGDASRTGSNTAAAKKCFMTILRGIELRYMQTVRDATTEISLTRR
jgi:hypothetical protein